MWLSNFPNTAYYWLLCHKLIDQIWVDLFLSSLFCSTDLYVCVMPVLYCLNFYVVQPLSCVWLFETPWTAACQASLSFTISWSLLKLMSTESVIPSHHLILYRPLLLLPSIFPSISLFRWASYLHQVVKVLELQLQHQSFQWIFRTYIQYFITQTWKLPQKLWNYASSWHKDGPWRIRQKASHQQRKKKWCPFKAKFK